MTSHVQSQPVREALVAYKMMRSAELGIAGQSPDDDIQMAATEQELSFPDLYTEVAGETALHSCNFDSQRASAAILCCHELNLHVKEFVCR